MINSRERILAKIKDNKPTPVSMGKLSPCRGDASLNTFRQNLESISGKVIEVPSVEAIESTIRELFPSAQKTASTLIQGTTRIDQRSTGQALEMIEVAILKGDFGVVENGAVWLSESNMLNRSLPFITQHLVLVIKKEDMVASMHEAYERCRAISYGLFIAGPSKTADIEQSLVIGAHGARSLTVILS